MRRESGHEPALGGTSATDPFRPLVINLADANQCPLSKYIALFSFEVAVEPDVFALEAPKKLNWAQWGTVR